MSDAHGIYYKSDVPYSGEDLPWQLFVQGKALTPARWPNALMWTTEWWDRDATWARQTADATCGTMVDSGNSGISLAATGVSFDGCNAIVNNEHWVPSPPTARTFLLQCDSDLADRCPHSKWRYSCCVSACHGLSRCICSILGGR